VWASQDIGDGLGFDIISLDESDDSKRMLEVKTTGLGKFFPFYVTGNEVRCSEDIPNNTTCFAFLILAASLTCTSFMAPCEICASLIQCCAER
jgi:hypothetical protein